MFESAKRFAAEVRVKRAKAALRRELRASARQVQRATAAARRVERAARQWEAAAEAESVAALRAIAKANVRAGLVTVLPAPALPVADLEAPAVRRLEGPEAALFLPEDEPGLII